MLIDEDKKIETLLAFPARVIGAQVEPSCGSSLNLPFELSRVRGTRLDSTQLEIRVGTRTALKTKTGEYECRVFHATVFDVHVCHKTTLYLNKSTL